MISSSVCPVVSPWPVFNSKFKFRIFIFDSKFKFRKPTGLGQFLLLNFLSFIFFYSNRAVRQPDQFSVFAWFCATAEQARSTNPNLSPLPLPGGEATPPVDFFTAPRAASAKSGSSGSVSFGTSLPLLRLRVTTELSSPIL
jgi:hypothetical protein